MLILSAWILLSVIQAAAMLLDELVYHRRRGLGLWERVSHPVDAALWALALGWLRFTVPGKETFWIFVALAVLSSAGITKDEWVHARECGGAEQWMHSVLFILHPTLLILGGAPGWGLWELLHFPGDLGEAARGILSVQIALSAGFAIYQIRYWQIDYWRRAGHGKLGKLGKLGQRREIRDQQRVLP